MKLSIFYHFLHIILSLILSNYFKNWVLLSNFYCVLFSEFEYSSSLMRFLGTRSEWTSLLLVNRNQIKNRNSVRMCMQYSCTWWEVYAKDIPYERKDSKNCENNTMSPFGNVRSLRKRAGEQPWIQSIKEIAGGENQACTPGISH